MTQGLTMPGLEVDMHAKAPDHQPVHAVSGQQNEMCAGQDGTGSTAGLLAQADTARVPLPSLQKFVIRQSSQIS